MKTSTATALGVTGLTAAVIGFGVAVPSLAEDDAQTTTTVDAATGTAEPDAPQAPEGAPTPEVTTTPDGTTPPGPGMPAAPGPGAMAGPHGLSLATAAQVLGLDEEDLLTQLAEGTTLGEVADAQGVARLELVDALVTETEEQLTALLDEPMTGLGGPGGGMVPGGAPGEGQGTAPGQEGTPDLPWDPGGSTGQDGSGTGEEDSTATIDGGTA
ncbi:hypothetical protein [Serinicoccus marinus]|uniref:hypothetical protein n=1 Tax=Serinicoccus marinus TaxID=247333 RepID=UPI002490138C|nr:hypothetical protein [Serinicoccus marinus]